MQKKRWVATFTKLGQLYQKKNRSEKFPFTATTKWIVVAVRWSIKNFFAPNSPIFRKSLDEERKQMARQLQSVMLYKKTQQDVGDDLSVSALNLQIL